MRNVCSFSAWPQTWSRFSAELTEKTFKLDGVWECIQALFLLSGWLCVVINLTEAVNSEICQPFELISFTQILYFLPQRAKSLLFFLRTHSLLTHLKPCKHRLDRCPLPVCFHEWERTSSSKPNTGHTYHYMGSTIIGALGLWSRHPTAYASQVAYWRMSHLPAVSPANERMKCSSLMRDV